MTLPKMPAWKVMVLALFAASCSRTRLRLDHSEPQLQTLPRQAAEPLQELRFVFKEDPKKSYEIKFCERDAACEILSFSGKSAHLVMEAPPLYSARVCKKGAGCDEWQMLILRPVLALSLTDTRPQTAKSFALTEESFKGVSIATFAKGEYILASSVLLSGLDIVETVDGFSLTARGIPNLGNTCFLNASLQLLHSSPEIQAAIKSRASAPDLGSFEKEFVSALNAVMLELGDNKNHPISDKSIWDLMQSYDAFVDAEGQDGIFEKFGHGVGEHWTFEPRQRAADEFITNFRNILTTSVSEKDFRIKAHDFVNEKGRITLDGTPQNYLSSTISVELDDHMGSLQELIESRYLHVNVEASDQMVRTSYTTKRLIANQQTGIPELIFTLADRLKAIDRQLIKDRRPITLGSRAEIEIPFTSAGTDANTQIQGPLYTQTMLLNSAVVHQGGANGGHYITYMRQTDGTWLYISDKTIAPVRGDEALRKMFAEISSDGMSLHFVKSGDPRPLTGVKLQLKVLEHNPLLRPDVYARNILQTKSPLPNSDPSTPSPTTQAKVLQTTEMHTKNSRIPLMIGMGAAILAPFAIMTAIVLMQSSASEPAPPTTLTSP